MWATRSAPRADAPSWAVAFSPDGRALAIGSYRAVFLYAVGDGALLGSWKVGADAVRALAFSPDGALLAVGSGAPGGSGELLLLDARSGQIVRQLKAHDDTIEALAFSGELLLSASDDERVAITDTRSGQKVGALTEHVGRCLSVAVPLRTSDGAGGAIFATGGADKMLKIWDAALRRVVVNFDQCQSPVWGLAALPQPGRFLAGCGDGVARLFQVRADRPDPDKPATRPARPGEPEPRTGSHTASLYGHDGPVYAVAAAANGNWMVTGGADGQAIVWNKDGGRVKSLTDAKADLWSLAIAPNSRWLATASRDGRARVYDLSDGSLVRSFPPVPKR